MEHPILFINVILEALGLPVDLRQQRDALHQLEPEAGAGLEIGVERRRPLLVDEAHRRPPVDEAHQVERPAQHRRVLAHRDRRAQGGPAPGIGDPAQAAGLFGPDTVDGIAPAQGWQAWWQAAVSAKRAGAPWSNPDSAAQSAVASTQ